MAKSLKELLLPILFFVEGAFWVGIVATGGGPLLLWAALAAVLSGIVIVAVPSNWMARPLAGASSLLGLMLTIYQAYEASTLLGTGLATLGAESLGLFVVFALIYVYQTAATISTVSGLSSVKP